MYRFLDLTLIKFSVYPQVIERMKGGEKFLDLGCCFGQELRRLQSFIVYTGALFHLFDYEGQVAVAKPVVHLLKPEAGSLVPGRQMGNINPGYYANPAYATEKPLFRHNAESWAALWKEVGGATGTR
ncbi:hypothetical protein EJ06DRAFT_576020 [Trichodelitschia bisporula]|uniref:Methyltransferase n=1 Tax=Trichodelitschia bisporula TaxID=703511 RepID=A0A6G1HZG9_9PEZI|nr:hypothetical protein EJ06DRAFT_576020 [Trichodelitschia bisporula]